MKRRSVIIFLLFVSVIFLPTIANGAFQSKAVKATFGSFNSLEYDTDDDGFRDTVTISFYVVFSEYHSDQVTVKMTLRNSETLETIRTLSESFLVDSGGPIDHQVIDLGGVTEPALCEVYGEVYYSSESYPDDTASALTQNTIFPMDYHRESFNWGLVLIIGGVVLFLGATVAAVVIILNQQKKNPK